MRLRYYAALFISCLIVGHASPGWATDGDFDPGFGQNGRVTIAWALGEARPEAVAIDAEGHIVLAGEAKAYGGVPEFMLLRLQPDGMQDMAFAASSGGLFLFDFGLNGIGPGGGNTVNAVRVQADGKIVTAGCTSTGGLQTHFAILRVTQSGMPDESFGANGSVHFSAPGTLFNCVEDFQLGPDGRIFLGGYTAVPLARDETTQFNYYAAIAALKPAGVLDHEFPGGGINQLLFAHQATLSYGTALAHDAEGRIVLAGFTEVGGVLDGAALRLARDGFLDTSFGTLGRRLLGVSEGGVHAIQVLPSGATVLAGTGSYVTGGQFVFLARLAPAGNLDNSFGDAGITRFAVSELGRVGLLAATKRAGWLIEAADGTSTGVWLFRTSESGAPDSSFGNAGVVHAVFDQSPGFSFSATKAALQADGKLVVAGSLGGAQAGDDFGVMRVLADYDTLFVDGFDAIR